MSSTTNQPANEFDANAAVELLRAIAAGDRSAASVAKLSDPSRDVVRRIQSEWPSLPLEVRRYLVRRMADLAETTVELNFSRLFRIAFTDDDPEVRAIAVAGLWEDESSDCLEEFLTRFPTEHDPAVREALVVALGRFAYLACLDRLDANRRERVRATLLSVVRSNESVAIRRRALESLSWLSDDEQVTEEIARAYDSPYHDMRVSALFAMGRNLDERWFDTLLRELDSDEPEIRFEAVRASGEFGDARALDRILSLVEDEDEEVQMAAVGALGQIGGRLAISALRRIVAGDNEALRDAAREALEEALQADDPLRPGL